MNPEAPGWISEVLMHLKPTIVLSAALHRLKENTRDMLAVSHPHFYASPLLFLD